MRKLIIGHVGTKQITTREDFNMKRIFKKISAFLVAWSEAMYEYKKLKQRRQGGFF
jgi:hypothetical protein